jgi:hypothetical protein
MADGGMARYRAIILAVVLGALGFGGGYYAAKRTTSSLVVAPPGEGVCWHQDGSRWTCPDTSANRKLFRTGSDILSGSVTLTTDSGSSTFSLPAGVDAIFLTPDGLQILQEHYAATDSVKAAEVAAYLTWARGPH